MRNLFEFVKENMIFNKFVLNELVCVEYHCDVEDEEVGIFTQSDYIIHVLSGKKTWKTIEGEWTVKPGQTLYVKKGAAMVIQDFDDDFCMLGFFLPDNVIRESLVNTFNEIPVGSDKNVHQFTVAKLLHKNYLDGFFQSMYPYFKEKNEPPESILKLKIKELLINIVLKCEDHLLISYLKSVASNSEPSLTHIMETNFSYNLKLDEFAKMCHRSLSKFKRDFFNHYNTTPGKWLLNKRLDHAAGLIFNKTSNISQIAFECGFEDVSHFSRVFKDKFGLPPRSYPKNPA